MSRLPDLPIGVAASSTGASGSSTSSSKGSGSKTAPKGWQIATATHYFSYAPCCKENPNYDKKADKSECEDYSACKYGGEFTGVDKKMSYEQVKNTPIVSFYDAKNQEKQDKKMKWWLQNVKGKKIIIRHPKTGKEMEVQPLDTCGDWDCGKCCTKEAKKNGGYLIDIEYNTAQKFHGNSKPEDEMQIQWKWA